MLNIVSMAGAMVSLAVAMTPVLVASVDFLVRIYAIQGLGHRIVQHVITSTEGLAKNGRG